MEKRLKYNDLWILQRADPFVCYKDGWYYFTASIPEYDCIALRKGRTLSDLPDAKEKVIWRKHDYGEMSEHIWAPELHFIFGKWYIYFAGGEKDDVWKIRPYVLECCGDDPMNDEWIERGKLRRAKEDEFSFEAFSLDTTVFENKGRYFCVWAEKTGVGPQISNLYIAELESAYQLKTVQVLLTTPDYEWERKGFWVNEGPSVLKHKDKIFLTYSASDTGINYCIGMLEANRDSDLLDPLSWKKERYPVLETNEKLKIYGPGHNSFTVDEEGNDIMVYHARKEATIIGNPLYNPNRHAMLMKIKWDKDDKPIFSYEDQ